MFLLLFAGLVVWLFASRRPGPVVPPPVDTSFCQRVNDELGVTGAGGQIAPVCGNTPYPSQLPAEPDEEEEPGPG